MRARAVVARAFVAARWAESGLVLLAAALTACGPGPGPEIAVREIRAELLFQPQRWSVEAAHPELAPCVERLIPSARLAHEKEDLPTLILAPPSVVSIALAEADGPIDRAADLSGDAVRRVLRAQVGIDRTASDLLANATARVRFEVLLDGAPAWSGELDVHGGSGEGAGWLPVAAVPEGNAGAAERSLPLGAARVLTLRTSFVGEPSASAPIRAGFGRLFVEEERTQRLQRVTPDAPSIVLVVMDTLRADRTTNDGYARDTTPHLAALAARGVDYRSAYAASSWTWPSTASLLTGLLPEAHAVTGTGSSYLAGGFDTLAEVLQRRGYATAGFVGNPLVIPAQNFDQGFQHFDHTRAGVFVDGDELVPRALTWLAEHREWRSFVYLHLVDPHVPYNPLPEARRRFGGRPPKGYGPNTLTDYNARMLRGAAFERDGTPRFDKFISPEHQRWMQDAYDQVVWTGDFWLGRLLQGLEELGLDDRTLVAFTSDHGEELLDHGGLLHGYTLMDETTRVPLVLAGPGVERGVVVQRPVSNRALFATLAQYAGVFAEGGDALPDLARPSSFARTAIAPVFFSTGQGSWHGLKRTDLFGVRAGDWTLHFAPEGRPWSAPADWQPPAGSSVGRTQLFDMQADPGQHEDLAEAEPERVSALLELIADQLRRSEAQGGLGTLGSGAGTLDMLEALGYIESRK